MGLEDETITIEHGTPKKVSVPEIEEELRALASDNQEDAEARCARCRMLTLAICCDQSDAPESLDELVGQIVTRNPARAIVLRMEPEAARTGLEAWVRTHGIRRGDREMKVSAEQITLCALGDAVRELPRQVLRLRVANLPLVIWWRGQPNLDNPLLKELLAACDRLIIDSARFVVAPSSLASFMCGSTANFVTLASAILIGRGSDLGASSWLNSLTRQHTYAIWKS